MRSERYAVAGLVSLTGVNPGFGAYTWIPVMLDGESTPEDLARDFLGVLRIGASQCIRNAQTADDILAGIVERLGGPGDLAGAYPQTPLERLQGGIAKILAEGTTTASLHAALEAVGCPVSPDGGPDHKRFADLLARRFLGVGPDRGDACFEAFERGIDPLAPRPLKERAWELFELVRPLWVQPAAAAHLPLALQHRHPLALVGQFVTLADQELETQGYTLERYLERAWPGSGLLLCVTLTGVTGVEEAKDEIRRRFFGGGLPPTINGTMQDRMINKNPRPFCGAA